MRKKFKYYFILYPCVYFLVFTISPILFRKEEHTSVKDTLAFLGFYYFLISVGYALDLFGEKDKEKDK
ncbi:hypothetical protein [Bacillus cereus]|uniref:Uncharacterized protein n=1 Tax=Bacillus cereus MC67 TaxID=1053219 RepID=J8C976_BACCE|nr:hypothetical protein [Bacillus cereus]EJR02729.1 hypothetical protein II3_01281 [Bacillus cereus MC67]EOP13400.1 hypothetical protein II1_03259 [Bacillus cereus MC118]